MAPATMRRHLGRELRSLVVLLAFFVAIVASSASASAQCGGGCSCSFDALVTKIGTGCGPVPRPTLNATLPILGQSMTLYVTSTHESVPLWLGSSSPPASPLVVNESCLAYLNLADLMLGGPFSTNAAGAWTFDWTSPNSPALCGLICNIQALLIVPGDSGGVVLTNAIQARMGCDPGGNNNGIPNNDYCSYSKGGFFSGNGTPGQLVNNHFTTVFQDGLEVGDFTPANGNTAPNGVLWQATSAGKTALKTYLTGGSSSGAFTSDEINPTSGYGAGVFGRQTAALALNVAFNDADLTNSDDTGFGDLVYIKAGNSLSGLKVRQILEVANTALAGLGLPPGYSFTSLKDLVENLDLSFDGCCQSCWSQSHLFRP